MAVRLPLRQPCNWRLPTPRVYSLAARPRSFHGRIPVFLRRVAFEQPPVATADPLQDKLVGRAADHTILLVLGSDGALAADRRSIVAGTHLDFGRADNPRQLDLD